MTLSGTRLCNQALSAETSEKQLTRELFLWFSLFGFWMACGILDFAHTLGTTSWRMGDTLSVLTLLNLGLTHYCDLAFIIRPWR